MKKKTLFIEHHANHDHKQTLMLLPWRNCIDWVGVDARAHRNSQTFQCFWWGKSIHICYRSQKFSRGLKGLRDEWATKTDKFSEKFWTAIDFPPSFFRKSYCIFFCKALLKVNLKPFINVQILQYKFLDLKWPLPPPLPPFGTFPKIHPFWYRHPSLRVNGPPTRQSFASIKTRLFIN